MGVVILWLSSLDFITPSLTLPLVSGWVHTRKSRNWTSFSKGSYRCISAVHRACVAKLPGITELTIPLVVVSLCFIELAQMGTRARKDALGHCHREVWRQRLLNRQ